MARTGPERAIHSYRKRDSAQCAILCALVDLFFVDPDAFLKYPELWAIGWTKRGVQQGYREDANRLIDEVVGHINRRLRVFFEDEDEQYLIERVRADGFRLVKLPPPESGNLS